MTRYRLVIGNKNYSSWSLRPWLFLRHHDIAFEEVRLALDSEEFRTRIGDLSPSGRVPVLHDGEVVVWDSLAILEYLAERHPQAHGWPQDPGSRALARSASAEMHSGFPDLRGELPMNCSRRGPLPPIGAGARRDIDRVQALWRSLRARHAGVGPFLCGHFGIVDCMFAPVVIRFTGYSVPVDGECRAWMDAMLALPAMQEWIDQGRAESERLAKYEAI